MGRGLPGSDPRWSFSSSGLERRWLFAPGTLRYCPGLATTPRTDASPIAKGRDRRYDLVAGWSTAGLYTPLRQRSNGYLGLGSRAGEALAGHAQLPGWHCARELY